MRAAFLLALLALCGAAILEPDTAGETATIFSLTAVTNGPNVSPGHHRLGNR